MPSFVILLRAIGPVTHRLMSMEQWRTESELAGLVRPQTYVATGNMVAESMMELAEVEARTDAILRGFGLPAGVTAVVRRPEKVADLIAANPFVEESWTRPSQVAAFLAKGAGDFSWVREWPGEERVHVVDERHLIVDYPMDVSKSRLSPGLIERRSKTVLTARNWNTIVALNQRALERPN